MANRRFPRLEMFNVMPGYVSRPTCPNKEAVLAKPQCFDVISTEDYDIYDYLNATDLPAKERAAEKRKRMIIFYGQTSDNVTPYCYSTEYIEHIDPLTHVYTIDCRKNPVTRQYYGTSAGSIIDTPIIRLDFSAPVYLDLGQFLSTIRNSATKIFLITPYEPKLIVQRTASIGTLDVIGGVPNQDMGRYVSADHCQAGTNKEISQISSCPKYIIDEYFGKDELSGRDKKAVSRAEAAKKKEEELRAAASRRVASRREKEDAKAVERSRKAASRREKEDVKAAERSRKAASRREAKEAKAAEKSRKAVSRRDDDSEEMPLNQWFQRRSSASRVVRESSDEIPLIQWFQRQSRKSASRKSRVPRSRKSASRKSRVSRSRKTASKSRNVKSKSVKSRRALSRKPRVKRSAVLSPVNVSPVRNVSPASPVNVSRNVVSRGKVSRGKAKTSRQQLLNEIKNECKEDGDVVVLEDFVDMDLKDLKSIVKTGKGAKKNCYKAETLYNILRTAAEQNIPVKDPLTNERLTKAEIKEVMDKMRKISKRAQTPRANTNMDPFAYMDTIPILHEPSYVTLYYVNPNPHHPSEKNLGVIPRDARLIKKINDLYEAGRLLRLAPGGIYEAPRIHLHKKLDYWKADRERLINKMIDEIDQLL